MNKQEKIIFEWYSLKKYQQLIVYIVIGLAITYITNALSQIQVVTIFFRGSGVPRIGWFLITLFGSTVILFLLSMAIKDRRKLQELTITDPVTETLNRRGIIARIVAEQARHERLGKKFCLLFLDIDFFKKINDNFSHLAGDYILFALPRVIEKAIRPFDPIGRFGGEEFLVIFTETELEKGIIVAERIRKDIADHVFVYNNKKIDVTVSGGVMEVNGFTLDEMLRKADEALYAAKDGGRNKIITVKKG